MGSTFIKPENIERNLICSIHAIDASMYCPKCAKYRCNLCDDIDFAPCNLPMAIQNYNDSLQTDIADANVKTYTSCFYFRAMKCKIKYITLHFIKNAHIYSSIIHYFDGFNLAIFTLPNRKIIIRLNKKVNERADSISYGNKIFAIGGNLTNENYEVFIPHNTLTLKCPMKIEKYEHSLCISRQWIYSIGGNNRKNALNDTQKYDIANDKWIQLPNLNTPSKCCAAFSFFNYIYRYGGYNSDYLYDLDKLSIFNSLKWENVAIKNPIGGRYSIQATQINNKRVLLFGGYNFGKSSECYLIDINMEFAQYPNMLKESLFFSCCAPILKGSRVYCVDRQKEIYIYENEKWGTAFK